MNRCQFLALCCCAFAGCYLGGLTSAFRPAPASAQVQIRSENTLFVPEGGLRMVNAQNRTLGVITDQGGNGGLVFLDASGKPCVTIAAGPGGFIDLNASSPAIRVAGANGQEGLTLSATNASATVKLRNGIALTSAAQGGQLTLATAKGSTALQIDAQTDGGRLTGYDSGKSTQFELKSEGGEGVLSLFKKDSEAGFQAHGTGSAEIKREKETLWKVPDSLSSGDW